MSQATVRFSRNSRQVVTIGAAMLALLGSVTSDSEAVAILRTRTDQLDHNVDKSAFFTARVDGGAFAATDENWFPKETAKAGEAVSTTPTKTYNIVGNSTSAGSWVDGNGVPAGLTLTFKVEFTISALPLSGGSYLTNPGNGTTGTNHGGGIGITQTLGGIDDIDKPDGIQVSAATISDLAFSGTLTEPNFAFTPGGISNFGTRVFRSNNFNEANAGMLLTQGTETIGFGLSTGTLATGLIVNNNFGTGGGGGAAGSSIFDRRVGPYTLVVDGPDQTTNVSVIKGIGVAYDVTYDITALAVAVPGDYNHNGIVDGADYVLWRKGDLAADSNGDSVVDQVDYDFWRARFDNTSGAGASLSAAAVPEPTSLMLLAFAGISAIALNRRSR